MKKNNTTRKQLFVVIKKTRSFTKKTEINSQSQQNNSEANNTASGYSVSPATGLDNIRSSAPESARPSPAPAAASQPTPPTTPPVTTVPPLPKFSPPQTPTPPVEAPTQPAATNTAPPSQPTPAPTAAAPTNEPAAPQEPATAPFAPDYAAAGSQLSKLMSGMAAPLSRLAGTVPGLLSSASTSLVQAAKGKAVESKPAPVDVKPVEVDVKINSIASTSSSDSSTPTAATALSNNATALTPKPIATVTWNPATTISSLQRKAKKESIGYCARAVVDAIQAGGTKIERAPAAKDLGSKLIAAGFTPIFSMPRPSREYDRSKLLPGDVVILEGFKQDIKAGIKKEHKFGHAAMYDGSKWISDFTQSGFYPGPDYRVALPGYTIYRMVTTQAQIDAINASQNTEPASHTAASTPPATVTQATRSSTSAPVSPPAVQTPRPSATVARRAQQTVSPSVPLTRSTVSNSNQSGNKPISSDQDFLKEFNIDISFLRESEGMRTDGYVPLNKDGTPVENSGVTIGMGIDLGQREAKDLIRDGVPSSIVEKLKPYMKLKKTSALQKIREMPLRLTSNEINILSNIYIQKSLKSLETEFDNESKGVKFSQLPANTRTMILDLAHQYGNLKLKTPKTWGFIINQQWDELVRELNNFHDKYPTRREREAKLIKDDLNNGRI
ncbi:pesticin C-terminus-like muramidase [Dickeya zeae]|uniref:pesticin C-terminus-like muramidase n=2 Tax=Dickeya zeae TaxID=204042 RepID=UPI0018AD47C4|nr:pesticin C-terminus-like muramidase [Dickeya zeae]